MVTETSHISWSSAMSRCESKGSGSHLAEITTAEEQASVASVIRSDGIYSYGYWIALTDSAEEGKYVWAISGEEATYFAWAGGQPDSGTVGNCVCTYSIRYRN